MPIDIRTQRDSALAHHVAQGCAWLNCCETGAHTVAISYAAFEFRLVVERLAVQYWLTLLGREPDAGELENMYSFGLMRRRIHQLAGKQPEIDRHFEFMRHVLVALSINRQLVTPDLRQLGEHWGRCSARCHVSWTFESASPEECRRAFEELVEVQATLLQQVQSLGWPIVRDAGFADIRNRFVSGAAAAADVEAYFAKFGGWGRMEHPADPRQNYFVGHPIPPVPA